MEKKNSKQIATNWIPGKILRFRQSRYFSFNCDFTLLQTGLKNTVLSFGAFDSGRLGLGKIAIDVNKPTEISLGDKKPIRVACGWSHSFIILDNGGGISSHPRSVLDSFILFRDFCSLKVLAFGKNTSGQLGVGDLENRFDPTPITSLEREKIDNVCGGFAHSICLTSNQKIYSFGDGTEGQVWHLKDQIFLFSRFIFRLADIFFQNLNSGNEIFFFFLAKRNLFSIGFLFIYLFIFLFATISWVTKLKSHLFVNRFRQELTF